MTIKLLLPSDFPDVKHLEQGAHWFPWSDATIMSSLCSKTSQTFGLYRDEVLAAYCVVDLILDELTLQNLAVDERFRRQGLAEYLLKDVFARYLEANYVFLEVRESNSGAIKLYRKLGFARCGLRKNYYPGVEQREHAVVMRLDIE